MKTLIVAINSKYIHSSLAPWYLKAYCQDECGEIKVREFTINDSLDSILFSIYKENADVIAFSCYIWNISYVKRIVENLRKVCPQAIIVLGGPEVSFENQHLDFVDYIICGEGEIVFKSLLKHLSNANWAVGINHINNINELKNELKINGLISRSSVQLCPGNNCQFNNYQFVEILDEIPSPYTEEMLSQLGDRIVYFESSRGCPFSCSYCLSSIYDKVRYFSIERVKRDLTRLIDAHVKQVKFVDRTFNCNRARAKEIFQFIMENARDGRTNFHFEAAADLFDDEMLDMLKEAPPGLIQFEIGFQTTNPMTLEEISRKTDLKKGFENVRRLIKTGNIHVHVDLIAGLPFENLESFKSSFNSVYSLKAHYLQVGFLKMLKGSRIRREAELHGYRYREYPPYEVLFNKYLSFDEMIKIKGIEELIERYYNSGKFFKSVDFAIKTLFSSAIEFYSAFYSYYVEKGYINRSVSVRDSYTILLEFIESVAKQPEKQRNIRLFKEFLKFDFLASDNSRTLPGGLAASTPPLFKERCYDFLNDGDNIKAYLPMFAGMPPKQVLRYVHFEHFDFDVTAMEDMDMAMGMNVDTGMDKDFPACGKGTTILFNYKKRDRVTGLYEYNKVNI